MQVCVDIIRAVLCLEAFERTELMSQKKSSCHKQDKTHHEIQTNSGIDYIIVMYIRLENLHFFFHFKVHYLPF